MRIWYIIEHRANPSTIKKVVFTSNPENSAFFKNIFFDRGGGLEARRLSKEKVKVF